MKIAINCSFFIPKGGGIKEYIFNLVSNLNLLDNTNEYILYVAADQYDYAKVNLPSKMRIKKTPFNSNESIMRSIFEKKFYMKEEQLEKFDIFHSPFFHIPTLKNAIKVITIHDLRLYRYPKTYSLFRYLFLKHTVGKSITKADHIIAISEFTKSELLSLFKISADKITVIHEAVNSFFFNENIIKDYKFDNCELINNPFLLTVGHIEPRKNYENLIYAFNKVKKEYSGSLKLVIVGRKHLSYKVILDLIRGSNDIVYLDFVEHKQLIWLYKNAKMFLFPSYYEGFGFPPLEAATLNTVSIVSNRSSIPEVCGNSSFYFDPSDVNSITKTILFALNSPDEVEMKRKILKENINRFSWKTNAQRTMSIYNSLYPTP